MSENLKHLRSNISCQLAVIGDMLPDTYKLTLIARNSDESLGDTDIVLTEDDLDKALSALNHIKGLKR